MKIALLGDIHGYFDDFDVRYFNGSDYDYLLFTGDFPGIFHHPMQVYRTLAKIKKKCYFIWGNHDGFSFPKILGEITGNRFLQIEEKDFFRIEKKKSRIEKILGENFRACGYQIYSLTEEIALFSVRPHSMGGGYIGFIPYMIKKYGVSSMETSFEKMKSLLHEFLEKNPRTKSFIFLGHNGPYGLGSAPYDIWGCDFRPDYGDFGDRDFRLILDYTLAVGFKVLFVVAGHMHHKLAKKARKFLPSPNRERIAIKEAGGIYFINPAKVPRIFRKKHRKLHYHIRVELEGNAVRQISEILV